MTIGIFLQKFPVLSETFVSYELLSLQEQKVKLSLFCAEPSFEAIIHPHVKTIDYKMTVFPQKILLMNVFQLFISIVYWQIFHPLRMSRVVLLLIQNFSIEHFRIFLKTCWFSLFQKTNIDLIYVHEGDVPSMYGLFLAKLLNKQCICIFHTYFLLKQSIMLKTKLLKFNKLIFQTQYSLTFAQKFLKKSLSSKSAVINTPGVRTQDFTPGKKVNNTILCVARIEPMKGLDILIRALAMLKKKGLSFTTTIVGTGSQQQLLQNLVTKNGLEDDVHFVGPMVHSKKLKSLFSTNELFILPSRMENDGHHDVQANVLREAMASGCITITTNLPDVHELIDSGKDGFVIAQNSVSALSDCLFHYYSLSPQEKKSIRQKARNKMIKRYNSQYISKKLVSFFFSPKL